VEELPVRISEVMTKDVATCHAGDSLAAAARIMWERDCGFAPVVASDTGRLVGVVTDRDACMAAYTKGLRLEEIPVASVMTKEVQTCGPADDVAKAEEVMARHQVRRLPVVDPRGALVGVISLNDLAREALQVRNDRAKGDVADTLGRIGRQRSPARAPTG
jgi:CBS domain-containing protein